MSSKRSNARKTPISSNGSNVHHLPRPFNLRDISPMTIAQKEVFKYYRAGKNLFLTGSAGTGKTFLALYLALREQKDSLDSDIPLQVVVVRSAVATRDIGALPGDITEKCDPYESVYSSMCAELYGDSKAYNRLKGDGTVKFVPTSYIRGTTISNAIIIVDEYQNLSGHELDSIMTRPGKNSKIIFCGDHSQSDLSKEVDRKGAKIFEEIIERMKSFEVIDFHPEDIVRSGLVKEYLLTKG